MFIERSTCIFCVSKNLTTYFSENYTFPVSSYCIRDLSYNPIFIPFNVLKCENCKTFQTKYLGDLEEIYKINHADACGSIRNNMMNKFSELILSNSNVHNILEIGAGNGILSDILLNEKEYNYTIVDPSYFGNTRNKKIIKSYFEDIEIENIDTIIISHVFEHFYEPLNVLEKLKNSNIQNLYLNYPDLESYVKDGTYHVLNPEHTFYTENEFLINVFNNYGFELIQRIDFENHSIFLQFKKNNNLTIKELMNKNSEQDIDIFYNTLNNKIINVNNEIEHIKTPIYLWPCSMHSIYLCVFGLQLEKITGFMDNSLIKIDKYLYGYNKKCYKHDDTQYIITNGGCFNKELVKS